MNTTMAEMVWKIGPEYLLPLEKLILIRLCLIANEDGITEQTSLTTLSKDVAIHATLLRKLIVDLKQKEFLIIEVHESYEPDSHPRHYFLAGTVIEILGNGTHKGQPHPGPIDPPLGCNKLVEWSPTPPWNS